MSDDTDNELFDVLMLDPDDSSVLVLTSNYESDFAFAYFDDFVAEQDLQDMEHEDILGLLMDYCLVFIDPDLMEENCPSITRIIFSESNTIITLLLDPEVIEYLDSNYEDGSEIEALFNDSEDDEVIDDDEEVDEEEDDDDWKV